MWISVQEVREYLYKKELWKSVQERGENICARAVTTVYVQERAVNICARESWEYLCKKELRISVQKRAENISSRESWEYLCKREMRISLQEGAEKISLQEGDMKMCAWQLILFRILLLSFSYSISSEIIARLLMCILTFWVYSTLSEKFRSVIHYKKVLGYYMYNINSWTQLNENSASANR